MKWTHILDGQPRIGARIVMLEEAFLPLDNRRYTIHFRNYTDHRDLLDVSWEEWIKDCEKNNSKPCYWWMYAEDFQCPEKVQE